MHKIDHLLMLLLAVLLVACTQTEPAAVDTTAVTPIQEIRVEASYALFPREEMIKTADAIFAGRVLDISPTQFNQDSGEYWEATTVEGPGLETTHTALPVFTIELTVEQVLVDDVGLGETAVLTQIGYKPIDVTDPVLNPGDTIQIEGMSDWRLQIGDEIIAFVTQSEIAWWDGQPIRAEPYEDGISFDYGRRSILAFANAPGDTYLLRQPDGRYVSLPNAYDPWSPLTLEEFSHEIAHLRPVQVDDGVFLQITTPEPSPTPAACTPLPAHMTLEITPTASFAFTLELTGLQEREELIIILSGKTDTESAEVTSQPTNERVINGRYTEHYNLSSYETIPLWQGKVIHAQGVACFEFALPLSVQETVDGHVFVNTFPSQIVPLADYPPNAAPYFIAKADLWLIHTPEGQLIAFTPWSPDYRHEIDMDECRFAWVESVARFVDPCSGDEWALNGRLSLAHSGERWSNRDLDQYAIMHAEEEGMLFIQWDQRLRGLPVDEQPLAVDAQLGVTVTAVTAAFAPSGTLIDTLGQVSPIWGMDPSAFPPQQALTYVTTPDSLVDDQGRAIPPTSRNGEATFFNPQTGGLQQLMHNHWQAAASDARVVTATLKVELINLYRAVTLPLDWSAHQAGDVWELGLPLEIGYAAARVPQVEWVETLADGRARLRLTVTDASPDTIRLYCLHLDTTDPWERTCANFDGQLTYTLTVQIGEPVALHLRAWLELLTPFQLVLAVSP